MERNRYAHFAGLLMLSLLVSGQVFAQSQEQQDIANLRATMERTIQGMQVSISALENQVEVLNSLQGIDKMMLANVIVMTDRDCTVLGPDWRRYEGLGGRFPIGAGGARDAREEERTFARGDEGGEYLHQLTLDEMPSHSHVYTGAQRVGDNKQRCGGDCPRVFDRNMDATAVGGNHAHNNMPPYVVMNFCHIETESRD